MTRVQRGAQAAIYWGQGAGHGIQGLKRHTRLFVKYRRLTSLKISERLTSCPRSLQLSVVYDDSSKQPTFLNESSGYLMIVICKDSSEPQQTMLPARNAVEC